MSDGAGGCNQKPLIRARASALPKNEGGSPHIVLDIYMYVKSKSEICFHNISYLVYLVEKYFLTLTLWSMVREVRRLNGRTPEIFI